MLKVRKYNWHSSGQLIVLHTETYIWRNEQLSCSANIIFDFSLIINPSLFLLIFFGSKKNGILITRFCVWISACVKASHFLVKSNKTVYLWCPLPVSCVPFWKMWPDVPFTGIFCQKAFYLLLWGHQKLRLKNAEIASFICQDIQTSSRPEAKRGSEKENDVRNRSAKQDLQH